MLYASSNSFIRYKLIDQFRIIIIYIIYHWNVYEFKWFAEKIFKIESVYKILFELLNCNITSN